MNESNKELEKREKRAKLILERESLVKYAKSLSDEGYKASEIAKRMCLAESTVRAMLAK